MKRKALRGSGVVDLRKCDVQAQKSPRGITLRYVEQSFEILYEQAGAHEQNQSEGNFGDHESAAQAAARATSTRASSALLERFAQMSARGQQGGSNSGQNSADNDNEQRKEERITVESDGLPSSHELGHIRRHVRQDQLDFPLCEEQPERGARSREQYAFGEQLANNAPATSAQCCAHRKFAGAPTHARELHVSNINASDEQDKRHRDHKL